MHHLSVTIAQARSAVVSAAKLWAKGADPCVLHDALAHLYASEERDRKAMNRRMAELQAWMDRPTQHFRKMHVG